ncbi:uncharacterized protein LOC105664115 [Megachile rotundata]|uniref:uncharacterized protein LOC105664115 n=1 Tax=Megachile rotundata TaxID=143995 RepID=UPI000614F495|nr:PREDICTED: uncharacterized protein LOC105664115 isoform X2 [Megachile rotundata]XP_012152680.1 PREDICTED: uncharacterized protein LOC105664115 isoform X2 [Megachile rotundata]
MRTSLVLLAWMVTSATAASFRGRARLFPDDKDDALPLSTETEIVTVKDATNQPTRKQSVKTDSGTNDSLLTSIQNQDNRAESSKRVSQGKDKVAKRTRKHKAIFVNYPVVQQLRYDSPYDVDYTGNDFDTEARSVSEPDYQESDIFYIRLPPTPYMFVPGLGYVSQPPTYSTANLRPQISYARPRPKPAQPVNPFIKLPIDFVSNGKPTAVYQWQKKPSKKPTDSPITNLDSLSAEFVNNGKPTSIYQWQSSLKPTKISDDVVNNLDKGPYTFNGKPARFFLLKSDGTSSRRQSFRFPDFQLDNSYY